MPNIEVNGVTLAYEDAGAGEKTPIIFVHGWTADMRRWDDQFQKLQSDRRVIRFDLRGHGRSGKNAGPYTIQQLSDDLYVLMQKKGVPKAVLAGHSMGGMTIQTFALQHLQMVDRLMLVNTLARFTYGFDRVVLFQLIKMLPFRTFVRLNIVRAFHKGFPKARLEELVALSQNTPRHVVMAFFDDMAKFDVLDQLKNLQVKTLVIHSAHDQQLPLAQAKRMAAKLPDATMRILDCGHESPLERGAEMTRIMQEFLGT